MMTAAMTSSIVRFESPPLGMALAVARSSRRSPTTGTHVTVLPSISPFVSVTGPGNVIRI
jgi:hypothetical protein